MKLSVNYLIMVMYSIRHKTYSLSKISPKYLYDGTFLLVHTNNPNWSDHYKSIWQEPLFSKYWEIKCFEPATVEALQIMHSLATSAQRINSLLLNPWSSNKQTSWKTKYLCVVDTCKHHVTRYIYKAYSILGLDALYSH